MKMTWEQKKAHERLMQSLPITTHFKKYPEERRGGYRGTSLSISRANGRKGRLAARAVGGY
jgi:hypothetical protein